MRVVITTMLIAFLAGCIVTPPTTLVPLETTWSDEEVAWFNTKGAGQIAGSALLRTVGGEARTCAALPAYLIPASKHAVERFTKLYGNPDKGYVNGPNSVFVNLPGRPYRALFESDDIYSGFHRTVKITNCDPGGEFEFNDLPEGEYFVGAEVTWRVYNGSIWTNQGGFIIQRVELVDSETKSVILTP